MTDHALVRSYLKDVKRALDNMDTDRRRKKEILSDIEGHIRERIDLVEGTVSKKDIQRIIKEFGDPEEIVRNYISIGSGQASYRDEFKGSKRFLIPGTALLIVIILVSATIVILLNYGGKGSDRTIIPGEGFGEVRVGDDMDRIIDKFGNPEDRVESGNTVWLSYRRTQGLDFLIDNATDRVLEIRFNVGYDGSLKDGSGIGDPLENTFDSLGDPLKRVNVTKEYVDLNPEGQDRVLYWQVDKDGVVEAYKYVVEREGILFWAGTDQKIIQIVVFEPTETVPTTKIETSLDVDQDTLTISVKAGTIKWSDHRVTVDGTNLTTDSLISRYGESAIFKDNSGKWDPVAGMRYDLRIITISSNTVIYLDMIKS
jgi:hypothetical protein